MSRLIYIDTNVYVDYFENRSYGLRPASEFAFIIIQRAISCEFNIVISTLLVKELEKRISQDEINRLFSQLREFNKIIDAKITYEVKKLAEELTRSGKIHYADAIHYALAFHAKAEAIITNDRAFRNLSNSKLEILLPEEA